MADHYLPIEDHAAIGNLRTTALVGRNGSIDWCCLPQLDSPSVFAALLDHERGGRFLVRAADGPDVGEQRYLPATNIVETVFDSPGGRLVVTDLLPLAGSIDGRCGDSRAEPVIHRLLRADGGQVEVLVEWSPRFDYGRHQTRMGPAGGALLAWAGEDAMALAGLPVEAELHEDRTGPVARARFTIDDGREVSLTAAWGSQARPASVERAHEILEETAAAWRGWVQNAEASSSREWAQPHHELVLRSELALKLLTHADTGAIAAAATTSLPEEIHGVRNWDYRYSWIRDAALGAQALFATGHRADAHAFIGWAERSARDRGETGWGLQVVYGLHGQEELPEADLPNLEGYRRSAPVRIGNGAVDQVQLDIYGELISAAYEAVRMGDELEEDICRFLPVVADRACRTWQERDYGIWEPRNGPFHFVYSKAMVWMALDRAIRLAERGAIEGDVGMWRRNCDLIRDEVLDRGFDADLGAFKQSYERPVLDTSNVLLPLLEILPFSDPRVQATIDRTLEELTEERLVYRYHADDGVAGREGSFGLCTFWLIDALALSGRLDEAEEIYEGMADRANHVGLYSEQIDPASGAFLGNFPQAFTHIGLINSTLYLAHCKGRDLPIAAPIGSDDHRHDG
jgi:GH15 family glucan-1,4-alpha-glucosidase